MSQARFSSSSARFAGASFEPKIASSRMSIAIMRSLSAAVPVTKPTAQQAFSGAVFMGVLFPNDMTGACSSSGFGAPSAPASAASGPR